MDKRLIIGKILKPWGLKGEVKVKPFIENPEDFLMLKYCYVGKEEKRMEIKKCSARFGYVYIIFNDIDIIEKAEPLRSLIIKAEKEQLTTREDEYYIDDIIGFSVYSESNKYIGQLVNVEKYGAADVFVVLVNEREYSMPFIEDIFLNVDTENKKITVNEKRFEEAKI